MRFDSFCAHNRGGSQLAHCMKLKLQTAVLLTGIIAVSAIGQEPNPATTPSGPPDKEKVSYALGMNLGLQLKHADADVDVKVIAQAINDVLAGKPTRIQQSEIQPLFRQAQEYGLAKQGEKNKIEGEAYLAKNAKMPGITVLPDGLQYRILQTGTGEIPKTNDIINITYQGKLVDGTEFERRDHIQVRTIAEIKGMQEALQLMKAGSKWQIFVPAALAYGHEQMRQVGPNSTLIFELELNSIVSPLDFMKSQAGTGRMGHGLGQDESTNNLIKPR